MKRVACKLLGLLIVLLGLAVQVETALSCSLPLSPPPPPVIILEEKNSDQAIDAYVGQILELRLGAHPSTGYVWEFTASEHSILQIVDRWFEPESDLVGSPGEEIIRLQVTGRGSTQVHLAYRRPWDATDLPAKEFTINVRVEEPLPYTPQPRLYLGDELGAVSLRGSTPRGSAPGRRSVPITSSYLPETQGQGGSLPPRFDWREEVQLPSVRDQGACGSCWAFATVGVTESVLRIWEGLEADLSEQYLVGHNEDGWGCDGGLAAFDYYIYRVPLGEREAGAILEDECPYVAADVKCPGPQPMHHRYTLAGWRSLSADVEVLKRAIYEYGPIWSAVCAGPAFGGYSGGVFETDEASYCPFGPNHAVVLVGWDDSQGTEGVWILRNSWGSDWGEGGYMRIGYGVSLVGSEASAVSYQGATIDPLASKGGIPLALSVASGHAYLAHGAELIVLNLSEPDRPAVVGAHPLAIPYSDCVGVPMGIDVEDDHAYVASGALRIFDVSDPSEPREVGGFDPVGFATDVVVTDTLAYLADRRGLYTLNVTDPSHPSVLGFMDLGENGARKMALEGNYIYLATCSGLVVVNASDPTHLYEVSSLETSEKIRNLVVRERYVYLAEGPAGISIVDASDPLSPTLVGSLDTPSWARDIAISGHYAYVADDSTGLVVVDISDPTDPRLVATLNTWPDGGSELVDVDENYAYVAHSGCLWVVNVADPAHPYEEELQCYEPLARDALIVGDYAYVAGGQFGEEGIKIYDISQITTPVEVGTYQMAYAAAGDYPEGMDLSGDYLFVVDRFSVDVLDMSDPVSLTKVATFNKFWRSEDVDVIGNYAFVASGHRGLAVFDVSDPTDPFEVARYDPYAIGNFETLGEMIRVAVNGDYAFVGTTEGLAVLDVSTLYHPDLASFLPMSITVQDLVVRSPYVYLVTAYWDVRDGEPQYPRGIYVLNVSDPYSPTVEAFVPWPTAGGIEALGDLLYIVGEERVEVFSIEVPNEPTWIGGYRLWWTFASEFLTLFDNHALFGRGMLAVVDLLKEKSTAYILPSGGDFRSRDGTVEVRFGNGTFEQETAIGFRQWVNPPSTPLLKGIGPFFALEGVSHQSRTSVVPSRPFTVIITHTLQSGGEEGPELRLWDGRQWITQGITVEPETVSGRLIASVDRWGKFALFDRLKAVWLPLVLKKYP